MRVFSERGYEGASIRGISKVAGLNSPPLVYWYFESKRTLFDEVLAHFSRQLPLFDPRDRMDGPPEAVLPDLVRAELRVFDGEVPVRLLRVAVAGAAMDPASGRDYLHILRLGVLESLTGYLEHWSREWEPAGFDPAAEARALFGSVFFYVLNQKVLPGLGGRLPDVDLYARSVVRPVLDRLGAGGDRHVRAVSPVPARALPPALTRSRSAQSATSTSSRGVGGRSEGGEGEGRAPAPVGTPEGEGGVPLGGEAQRGGRDEPPDRATARSEQQRGGTDTEVRPREVADWDAGGPVAGGVERAGAASEGRGSAGRVAGFFEELSRERPRFVSPGDPPALPPRREIPLREASSLGGRGAPEPPPAARGAEGEGSGSEEAGGARAASTEPSVGPVPASRQPFPAEPPRTPTRQEETTPTDEPPGGPRAGRGGVRKALFFVLPARAHVQGALPVARELVSRGEEVVLYATEEYEDLVRGAGVGFRALGGEFALPEELREGYLAAGRDLRPAVLRSIADSLRVVGRLAGWAAEEAADYVVYDPLCPWGRPISDSLGLPAVGLYTTFVARENSPLARRLLPNLEGTPPPALVVQMVRLRWELREARSQLGLPALRPADLLLRPADLNVVTLPERFQPPTGGALDERFVFVGPSILARDEPAYFSLSQIEAQPTVFVSLGPADDEARATLLGDCMAAFESSRWLVVVETGAGTDPALLGQAPPNVIAWPRVPRLEVLRRCDVFVTDGDVGATMEALWFGVPLVVVPRTPEGGVMAERVDELKMGLVLDGRETTGEVLREAVDAVGAEPAHHAGLADLWVAARQAGGPRLAADRIGEFVHRAARR